MALLGANGQPLGTPRPQPKAGSPQEPAPPQQVTTAFVVFQLPNGTWIATDDMDMAIVPSRPPSPDDLIAGSENVKTSVIAQKTAQITVQTQVAFAKAQAAQIPTQHEQLLAQKLMAGNR